MNKIDLNVYTSAELVEMITDLELGKFLETFTAVGTILTDAQVRGNIIADHKKKDNFNKFLKDQNNNDEIT